MHWLFTLSNFMLDTFVPIFGYVIISVIGSEFVLYLYLHLYLNKLYLCNLITDRICNLNLRDLKRQQATRTGEDYLMKIVQCASSPGLGKIALRQLLQQSTLAGWGNPRPQKSLLTAE